MAMEISDWLIYDNWTQNEAALLLSGINPEGTPCLEDVTRKAEKLFAGPIVLLGGEVLRSSQRSIVPLPLFCDESGFAIIKFMKGVIDEWEAEEAKRRDLVSKVIRLLNLIQRSSHSQQASPRDFIEWAISKGIEIPWDESKNEISVNDQTNQKGVNRNRIIDSFQIRADMDENFRWWNNKLSRPPSWLKDSLTDLGQRGISTLWNPADVAMCLWHLAKGEIDPVQ